MKCNQIHAVVLESVSFSLSLSLHWFRRNTKETVAERDQSPHDEACEVKYFSQNPYQALFGLLLVFRMIECPPKKKSVTVRSILFGRWDQIIWFYNRSVAQPNDIVWAMARCAQKSERKKYPELTKSSTFFSSALHIYTLKITYDPISASISIGNFGYVWDNVHQTIMILQYRIHCEENS